MDQEKIGNLFKERREAKNITQQELATILNVTDRAISNWEHGRRLPDYSLLAKLCDTLSISLDEIFILGKKEEKDKKNSTRETNELIDYYFATHSLDKDEMVLNKNYTLANFVEGECNEPTLVSCYCLSHDLGGDRNPFYIYGPKGTGKTHLLQGLGNQIKNEIGKRVLYVTSLQFIDDCYNMSSGHEKIQSFIDKYRNIDALLIDDIQLIKGDKPVIELFHVIDYLLDHNKQFVFTGDKEYNELNLDRQLKVRMGWVYQTPLFPLDYHTRRRILINLIKDFPKVRILKSAISYIAYGTLNEDARILKESVSQLIAYALITRKRVIGIKEAEEALYNLVLPCNFERLRRLDFDKVDKMVKQTNEEMQAFDRGEGILDFSYRYDKSFEYYMDIYNKSLHKKDLRTNEWYELIGHESSGRLSKKWMKLFNVDDRELKKINNFKKVIEYADKYIDDIENDNFDVDIDIDDMTR